MERSVKGRRQAGIVRSEVDCRQWFIFVHSSAINGWYTACLCFFALFIRKEGKSDLTFLAIQEENIHHVGREYFERIGRLRRQHDELTQFVVCFGITLNCEYACTKTVWIKVIVFDGGVAPYFVVEIARLIAPADVNPRGRRLHDPYATVAKFLIHQWLDAIDAVGRWRVFCPFVVEADVVPTGPKWYVIGTAPKDEPQAVG